MARKKNTDTNPTLTIGSEDTQIINSADLEATEAQLLNDPDEFDVTKDANLEDSIELITKEEVKATATEEKPKRQRRSKKAASKESISSEPVASLDLSKEVTIAKETIEVTMSTMVAQFTTIKDLTTGVNTQLEKMNALIKEMSPSHSSNLEELVKPTLNTQFITKFATAASLVAMLLSILSLSLSQSARKAILSSSLNNKENSSFQATSLKENVGELALASKDNSNRKSSFTTNIKSLVPFRVKK